MEGIYTNSRESSFESKEDIQFKVLYKGECSVTFPDRDMVELSFEELNEEMVRRSEMRQQSEMKEYFAEIEIETDHPIGVIWWADQHVGGQQVDYERLKWEADIIKHNPYMKVMLGGDFSDSFVWSQAMAGDIANLNEQNLYLYRLIEYVGWDKILCCVIGNHPKWARKSGLDGYRRMKEILPVFDGIGTVDLKINDISYIGGVIHKARGNSYLDPNFGGKRFLRENDGYDFVMTAHIHSGGSQVINQQDPNNEREVALLAGKTFKSTDDWHDTQGFKKKTGVGLGSNGIIFDHETKEMQPVSTMSKMIKYLD